jgi:hypothetical protein
MRTLLVSALLVLPLAAGGCKKNDSEATVEKMVSLMEDLGNVVDKSGDDCSKMADGVEAVVKKYDLQALKASAEILSDAKDPVLKQMAGFLEAEKLRSSFGKPLKQFGHGPLHSRYGWAETGRTTCSGGPKNRRSGLNIQQLPRGIPKKLVELMMNMIGEVIDVRSCFVHAAVI